MELTDSIISVKIGRPSYENTYEGNIRVDCNYIGFDKFMNYPLYYTVDDIFGRTIWQTKLHSGVWSLWEWPTWTSIKISDSKGNPVYDWKWDPIKDGCICHQLFHLWSLNNGGAFGIAIGTHDGSTGEWVGAVREGRLHALLVEASDKQFSELNQFYTDKNWVRCEQKLITVDGADVIFYETGPGHMNSIKRSHLDTNPYPIVEVPKSSQSLISLLESNPGYKWLHLDVEGIDDDLILSLKSREDLLPEVLIYEHESLSEIRENEIQEFLKNNSYQIYKSYSRNTIAFKS
jgi:hypothetical protein